jgi:hypothetical protein
MSDLHVTYNQDLLDDAAQPTPGATQEQDDAVPLTLGPTNASSPSSAGSTVLVKTLDSDDQSATGYDSEPSVNSQATGGDGVEIGPIPIPVKTC